MKQIVALLMMTLLFACAEEVEKQKTPEKEEILVEIKNGMYTEWYPGKKQIKYTGGQDETQRRNGVWTFYGEDGKELSVTMYDHGLREGFTVVKYPNGALHYRGEYSKDKTVGIWTTYNEKGEFQSEQDFGYAEQDSVK
jgi:antitoxin component YwqK of YwqJK toxin-antitoxin module